MCGKISSSNTTRIIQGIEYQICPRCGKPIKETGKTMGGIICVVVKSYVKGGKRVPLPMQTLKLLIYLGFIPLERIKAALVSTIPQKTMFGIPPKKKQRKSFFRRLAEKKGSPRIDFEEILICQKPEGDIADAENP